MSSYDDYLTAQALVAPLLRFEPIGRRMLGSGWSVGPGNWVRYRGRRVALRPHAYGGTPNLTGAILVLAAAAQRSATSTAPARLAWRWRPWRRSCSPPGW